MKTFRSKLVWAISLSFIFTLSSFMYLYPGGSPGGYTGSPGDGKDCTQCHGGSSSTKTDIISASTLTNGYVPGETYTIEVYLNYPGDKGFEVSPQDLQGNLIGSLVPGIGNKLVKSKAITNSSKVTAMPAEWSFQWTAPSTGVGDVTFYGAFTANKSITYLSTLTVKEKTSTINEINGEAFLVYPNPISDEFNLSFNLKEESFVTVNLVSLKGQKSELFNSILNAGQVSKLLQLNNNISTGIYFIELTIGDEVYTKEVLVQ